MKFRKKNRQMEKHRRRYLQLSITVFALVFVIHIWNLGTGWQLTIQGYEVNSFLGFLAAFVSGAMVFMGGFYLLNK